MSLIKMTGIILFCIALVLGGCMAVFSVGNYTNQIKFDLQLKDSQQMAMINLPVVITYSSGAQDTLYTDNKGNIRFYTQQSSTIIGMFYLFGQRVKPSYPINVNLHFPTLNKNFYTFSFNKKELSAVTVYNGSGYKNDQWAGIWEGNKYQKEKTWHSTYEGKTKKVTTQAQQPIEEPIFWKSKNLSLSLVNKDKNYYYMLACSLTLIK